MCSEHVLSYELPRTFPPVRLWRRSRKGNLWSKADGRTATVFARAGWFGWCVASKDGPIFSSTLYETEQEALDALNEELA